MIYILFMVTPPWCSFLSNNEEPNNEEPTNEEPTNEEPTNEEPTNEEPNELAERIEELQKQLELQELEQKLAEAKKATIEAQYPKSATQPLEGTITTSEKFGYIAEIVSYQAMSEKTIQVAKEIDTKLTDKHKVLIVDKLDLSSGDIPLIQIENQFQYFNDIIDKQTEHNKKLLQEVKALDVAALLIPAVVSVVGSIADIMGFFRTNYSITGQEFTLKNDALTANIAKNLSKPKKYILSFQIIEKSKIIEDFVTFLKNKLELEKTKDKLKHKSKEIRVCSKTTPQSQLDLTEIEAAIIDSETIISACNDFVKSITTVAEEGSLSLLVQAAVREFIRDKEITHILYLNIVSSGGEAITKQSSLARVLNTSFIGGSAFAYILAEKDGKIIISDTAVSLAQLDHKLNKKGTSNYKQITIG